jgi:hypothetical protein
MIRFQITAYSGLSTPPVAVVPGAQASTAEATKPQDGPRRPVLRLVK